MKTKIFYHLQDLNLYLYIYIYFTIKYKNLINFDNNSKDK